MSNTIIRMNDEVATTTATTSALELSAADQSYLADFDAMLELVRVRTRSVAEGYQNGCYLVGRPGSGKTQTVLDELERLDVAYTCRNSRMTSKGLFKLIEEHPEHILVLDDIPSLMREVYAQQTLLAALGGRPGEPRAVTLTTAETEGRRMTMFSGGIIAISNVPLRRDPLADAIQSRVPLLEHEPTDEMLAAAMRAEAHKGYKSLKPDECLEVVNYAIEQMRSCDYRLDLRVRQRALEDYRLWNDGNSTLHWQILVNSTIKRVVFDGRVRPLSKRDEIAAEQEIALKVARENPITEARDQEWVKLTGKSVDTLYRRLRELKAQNRIGGCDQTGGVA